MQTSTQIPYVPYYSYELLDGSIVEYNVSIIYYDASIPMDYQMDY